MITNDRVVEFIRSLEHDRDGVLSEVEKAAIEDGVPIIRKEAESFLETLVAAMRPERILELGTGTGYSALLMRESMPEGGHIITVENYPKRIEAARENIKKAGAQDEITLIEGDAADVIKNLRKNFSFSFDFVFMDAAKGQYLSCLEGIIPLLCNGAVVVADNVLLEGSVVESKFVMERRERTIHMRMREFLYVLKNDERFKTTIVPVGDGMTVSVFARDGREGVRDEKA